MILALTSVRVDKRRVSKIFLPVVRKERYAVVQTIADIQKLVVATICEIQEMSGRPIPDQIDGTLKPIGGFTGFDSLNAVEVAIQLSEKLGCEIKGNPFVEDRAALGLAVIAKRLHKLINNGESNGER
jgi:acyl carrier protein